MRHYHRIGAAEPLRERAPGKGRGGPAAVDGNGTVELTEPLRYTRVMGGRAEGRAFRFHADDPVSAVAALRASGGSSAGTVVAPGR
ncbi:hypothetical protein OHT52_02105 [Streptomyces sp. NBC_00247]|uniref:hypothetical protein n=1 Tax=Streptomyces sp. NBC_00247 TaxID=2975689 RepID=UPI002E2DDF7F|nr:hypothetical protein [Streptomyces sp. NBC_00247]